MPYDAEYWDAFIYSVAERTGRSPREIIYDEAITASSVLEKKKKVNENAK